MNNKNVVVLIPTLNEAQGIGKTIDDVYEWLPGCRILVIDSYSDDGTADIAREKAIVINAPRGGKGKAVRAVLPMILKKYYVKCYVMLDGDYTYPAKYILGMIREIEDGADVVIGYRKAREAGAMPRLNVIGNWGLSKIASLLYSVNVKDVCSGMWAFRRTALSQFNLISDGFTLEADLLANTMRCKRELAQIPIVYRARGDGDKPKLKVSDGFKIAWFLIRGKFRK